MLFSFDNRQGNERFMFLDVETPNCHNDRICSIGIIVTDGVGSTLDKKYFLVNPESRFDEVNMRIHGISPIDVREAMTFPALWETELSKMFSLDGVIAHNAIFDLTVIWKTFCSYGMEIPRIEYADTAKMAASAPFVKARRLPDLCVELGIEPPNHHMALSDAEACKDVFWNMVERTNQIPEFELYVPGQIRKSRQNRREHEYTDKTQAMRNFIPFIEGIISDGEVSTAEAIDVLDTIARHELLSTDPTIKSIVPILQSSVSDGYIDKNESDELSRILSRIVDPAQNECCSVSFEGKNFVLTGSFDHGTKGEIESYIESKGGCILKSVTKKCDYVVIGGQGSEAYAMGNYGTKVKKAMDWISKGVPIEIVSEKDIF